MGNNPYETSRGSPEEACAHDRPNALKLGRMPRRPGRSRTITNDDHHVLGVSVVIYGDPFVVVRINYSRKGADG